MTNSIWTAREHSTILETSSTGEIKQIRSIDPQFWSYDTNIDVYRYLEEHDEYLSTQRAKAEIIYHYTSLDALHGIVRDGAIWASDVRQLNDTLEVAYALKHMRALLIADKSFPSGVHPLDAIFGPGRTWQFVACFSCARDQLSQWRAYGNDIGITIAFDRNHIRSAVEFRCNTKRTTADC